jgi:hypothetical protein
MRRIGLAVFFASAIFAATVAVGTAGATSGPGCAHVKTLSTSGTVGTATFSVEAGCTQQVSLVSVSYQGGTPFIFDSATGTFTAGQSYTLTVKLPACGTDGEIDLVLGPPALFPPGGADLGAFYFLQPPCSTGPGTLTIGYWKNHADKWPITTLPLGGSTISEAAALTILNTPPRGDATIILADQLIAAELNVALGNTSTCISSTITAANALLAAHPVGSGLSTSSTAGATAVSLAATLDAYNNGLLCAPHQN